MTEPLEVRDDSVIPGLVVVRLGSRTVEDEILSRSVAECHNRWGIWGISVLVVPGGDYNQLARLRPIMTERRQLLVADAAALMDDGFPLLPTLDSPHWTVVLAADIPALFQRLRNHSQGPIPNPTFPPRNR